MQNRQEYDFSEFSPKDQDAESQKYNFSEFSPNKLSKSDNNVNDNSIIEVLLPSGTSRLATSAYETIKNAPDILGSIGHDILNTAKNIPGKVVETYGNIPKDIEYLKQNIPAAANLIESNPKLAAKSALGGGIELGSDISRIPPSLAKYLSKIGMIKPSTANLFPESYTEPETKEYVNKLIGQPNEPGSELIRGTVRNAPAILGGIKIASELNPLNLTQKNIIKDVLKGEKEQKQIHTNAYNKLWQEADKQGFNDVPIDKSKIDLSSIKQYSPEKYYASTENFINNPILKNAQKAQSDLGKLINKFDKKTSLTSEESKTYNAAKEAQKHIKEQMFKNSKGETNLPLKFRYNDLTKSYGERVIPYSTNKAIQEYKRGNITEEQLLPQLYKGKFAVKRSSSHPELGRREALKKLGTPLALLTAGGLSLEGMRWLADQIRSSSNNSSNMGEQ